MSHKYLEKQERYFMPATLWRRMRNKLGGEYSLLVSKCKIVARRVSLPICNEALI